MEFDTVGLGAGSYPDAPDYPEMKTVTVECSFKTYMQVPVDCENPADYIKEMYNKREYLDECDTINIEWVY